MNRAAFGSVLPRLRTEVPGPASRALADRLRAVESRNVTHLAEDFPVFWEEARGSNVRDADGNTFVDLTAAFGVALTGHGDAEVRRAVAAQQERLVHGMGDVHPPTVKVRLLERLAGLLPWESSRTVLATGGAEAVEIALKTAYLATGRPGILAFEGGYHGLTGTGLSATARSDFRRPFAPRLYPGVVFAPFPARRRDGDGDGEEVLGRVARMLEDGDSGEHPIGAVLVEPIQGRGGVRIPPEGFFPRLGRLARDRGALLVADEIFTGLGRTGAVLASPGLGLEPDVVCLGKALGGGYPLGACSGPAEIMDAWPQSTGEALHTSTFLGHPASCAAGVAFLDALSGGEVQREASSKGDSLMRALRAELADVAGVAEVRGRGLMIGIELVHAPDGAPAKGAAVAVAVDALREGLLVLPAGDGGAVVQLTPPVVLTDEQAGWAVDVLGRVLRRVLGRGKE